MSDNKVMVIIGANDSEFQAKMGRVEKGFQNVKDASFSIRGAFSALGITTGIAAATFTAFAKKTVDAALAIEKLNLQFKAVSGSIPAAVREMNFITELSNRLGLELQGASAAYGKFLAATRNTSIEGATARKVFEGVSEAVAALGLSADESTGIFLALSQMMSKGKVSAEELTGQLGERLPGALKLAADAMGLTTAELMKQMQEGRIMSADLLPRLAEQLHRTYGTAAEEAANKGQAGINRFNNEILQTKAAIGNHLLPAINQALGGMAEMLRVMRKGDWGFNPGNLLEPFNSNSPEYNRARRAEIFRMPKAGEDTSFAAREARIQSRLAADAALGNSIDPQMARIAADRRAEQDRINASRASAEKANSKESKSSSADKERRQREIEQNRKEGMDVGKDMLDLFYQEQERRYQESVDMGGEAVELFYRDLEARYKQSAEYLNPLGRLSEDQQASFDKSAMQSKWAANNKESDNQARVSANNFAADGDPMAEQMLQLERERDMYEQHWAMRTDSEEVYTARMKQITARFEREKTALVVAGYRERLAFEAASTQKQIGMVASAGVQMTNAAANSNKGMFLANKAFRLVEAGMELKAGVVKTFNSFPVPINFGMAALHAAAGAVQLADLASAGYGGSTGSPGGNYGGGTPTSPIVTQPGTNQQQQPLNITFNVNGTILSDQGALQRWFEESAAPTIRDLAVNRNVNFGFQPSN